MTLHRMGRLEDALKVCREILELQPERPDVLGFAGMIALELGRDAEAVRLNEAALAHRPEDAGTHHNLGNALKNMGRAEEAATAFRRAVEIKPDLVPAHNNLGNVLFALGRLEEAEEAYRGALAVVPGEAEILRNLGIVLRKLGRLEEAAATFRRVLEIKPGWPIVYTSLTTVLLELGQARAVVEVCEDWLGHSPGDIEALSVKALALNEVGESDAARVLLDYDRFVQVRTIEAPAPFADLAEFNEALARHVYAHPTLKVPPEDDPTYHHPALEITDELLTESKGPMAYLEEIILEAVADYRRTVPAEPPHPFLARWPERWHLASWATVLRGQGNLVPHIHFDGYLGGVYYPRMPDVVAEPGQDHAGWFELGQPPPELHCRAAPETRLIQPAEGRMLLFPSYIYHRTVPFHSAQHRISIAFDVVPEN